MVNKILKIMSILLLVAGLLAIMIIKNISVQKKNYLDQLKVELKNEENKNQLYKIQWDYLVSPINLKKLSEMILTNDYSKYFVVLDEKDLLKDEELYQDVISVFETQEPINLSR
jgi:hypothetical protein|tara:strand:- start:615 stop:956 length:342 start_codon:yes stop_codon:yes gene_type:complete